MRQAQVLRHQHALTFRHMAGWQRKHHGCIFRQALACCTGLRCRGSKCVLALRKLACVVVLRVVLHAAQQQAGQVRLLAEATAARHSLLLGVVALLQVADDASLLGACVAEILARAFRFLPTLLAPFGVAATEGAQAR